MHCAQSHSSLLDTRGNHGTVIAMSRRMHVKAGKRANFRLGKESPLVESDSITQILHDAKGALVPVMGYCEMILEGRLGEINDRQKNGLTSMMRSARRLRHLIEGLEDLGNLKEGGLAGSKHEFPLDEIVS